MDNRRAVLYCRVAHADDFAMEAQTEAVIRFANAEGYTVSDYYCDNGESGVTLDRPEMNRLLSDIRAGNVKTVIAKDMARIARDYMLSKQFLNEAQKYGVSVITVIDDISAISMYESLAGSLFKSKTPILT